MAAATIHSDFGAKKRKCVTTFTFSPSICHELMGLDAMILIFLIVDLKPALSLSSFTLLYSSRGSFIPLHLLPLEWYHPRVWGCWCFSHIELTLQDSLHVGSPFSDQFRCLIGVTCASHHAGAHLSGGSNIQLYHFRDATIDLGSGDASLILSLKSSLSTFSAPGSARGHWVLML